MPQTLIEQLGAMLAQGRGISVQMLQAEMLVTLPVGDGRKQTVRVATRRGRHGTYNVLEFQSRAFVASSPKLVSAALRANAEAECGGLVLDTSTNPPTVDVTYSLVVDEADTNDIFVTLQRLAEYADALELRMGGGGDEF